MLHNNCRDTSVMGRDLLQERWLSVHTTAHENTVLGSVGVAMMVQQTVESHWVAVLLLLLAKNKVWWYSYSI